MEFEQLDIWIRSKNRCVQIYQKFKEQKDFVFKNQITRSALSISSNIAECEGRESPKDGINFLSYAKRSCSELRSQIHIGIEIGYINKSVGGRWISETEELTAMISSFIKSKQTRI